MSGSGALFYRIDVKDMGEPGHGTDSYSILLSDGHTSGEQILNGGNIQTVNMFEVNKHLK